MYPQEYMDYLVHFHGDRDFFECHEILEGYWKKTKNPNKNTTLVGLILLAVSSYHHRRGNLSGARKTLAKALQIFSIDKQNLKNYGFQPEEFIKFVQEKLHRIQAKNSFIYFNLPLRDSHLIAVCKKTCNEKGFEWGEDGREVSDELIHRHLIRDRTLILTEREAALKNKKKKGKEL